MPTRAPFELGEDPNAPELPPVVLPEEQGAGRLARFARWALVPGAVLLVGAAAWWVGLGGGALPGLGGGPLPARSAAPEAAPSDSPGAPAEGASIRFATPAAAERLDRLLEELDSSLLAYRRRHADFGRGRISCEELASGYRRVDEVVVSLAMSRSRLRGSAGPERESTYEAHMERAAEVDRLFDRSGCPRP